MFSKQIRVIVVIVVYPRQVLPLSWAVVPTQAREAGGTTPARRAYTTSWP